MSCLERLTTLSVRSEIKETLRSSGSQAWSCSSSLQISELSRPRYYAALRFDEAGYTGSLFIAGSPQLLCIRRTRCVMALGHFVTRARR
jgi:hypothetical protein